MTEKCDKKWCEVGVIVLFILFALMCIVQANDTVIYRATHTEQAFMIDYDIKGMSDEYEVTFLCGEGFEVNKHGFNIQDRRAISLETLDTDVEVISSLSLDKVYAITFTHEWVLWGTPDKKLESVEELSHEPHRQTYCDLYETNMFGFRICFVILTVFGFMALFLLKLMNFF